MGRRRTEDDARPTASGRRGRARGEEAGGIDRIVEEEGAAADALQYLRCYSTAGTVHERTATVWGSPGSLREAERYDCSCLIRLIHLLSLYREVYLTPKQATN